MKTNLVSSGAAKKLLVAALMATSSAGVMAKDVPMNLGQTAAAIRSGNVKTVGKDYNLGITGGRFHVIHAQVLGIKCGGCHTNEAYPNDYLYLRKSEFPLQFGGMKIGAVERAKCIGCHSEGSVATAFYNK